MNYGSNRVIARIRGGIGNQLFIFSAARRLALRNNSELVLDDVSGFVYDHQYQRKYQLDKFNIQCRTATASERFEPLSRQRRYCARLWNSKLPFDQRRYLHQEGVAFDQRLLELSPKGVLYLEGYWQSERYFKDIASQIRMDLRIQPPTDAQNVQMCNRIRRSKSPVVIHIRFYEKPKAGDQLRQNDSRAQYYKRAIAHIDRHVPDAHFYIFSDQVSETRVFLPLSDDRMTFVSQNNGDDMAYADLWLMAHCKHFIIANSTFSWWGAWLSEYKNKIVIAPGEAFRSSSDDKVVPWGYEGQLPATWVTL